jgi:membrane protease YdiL (CAAX protease family)
MEKARRGLLIYFAVLIPVSAILETIIMHTGLSSARWLVFGLMWTPAIASFVARTVLKEGIKDVSFRLSANALWTMVAAVLFPLVVGTIAYGAGWATGLVGYTTPKNGFLLNMAIAVGLGCTVGVVSGAGEEIGWRGYMLTRLVDAGVPMPLLASGIIWALWHFPLILSGVYAAGPHPGVSAGIFLVDVVGIGYMIGILRLRSGSVWPAALLHGAWNGIIQIGFDPASTGPGATTWVGESGIFVAVVSLAIGFLAARKLAPATGPRG